MLIPKLIEIYRKKEIKRVRTILLKKGISCKVFPIVEESARMPNNDPFNISVKMQSDQYAVNRVVDVPLIRNVFFLKRMGELWHENEILGDMTSLRSDYVAYISDVEEIYRVGTIIEIDGIEEGRYIIHRAYKHRDFSKVKRYLLTKEFDGKSEIK